MTVSLPADGLILAGAALLAVGVIGAGLSNRLRVPGLLLFLGLGMLIGDDGLGLIQFDDAELAQAASSIALVAILFEGGLTTKPRDLRIASVPGLLLATVGVLITAGVVGVAAWWLLGVEPVIAVLLGSVVASTDAAAVFAVLRRAPLPRRLTAVLELESGANDPLAIMLTIGALELLTRTPTAGEWVAFAAIQLLGGAAVGLVVALAGAAALNRVRLGSAGLYPILASAVAGLAYGVAAQVGASGFLAVYVAGLLIGARVPRHRRSIRTFHDGVASAAGIGLFLLLGLLVFPSDLPAVAGPALAITAVLVLVARPLAVWLCLAPLRYRWADLTVLSWAGLRGAVPIVLATFPLAAGVPEGQVIFDVVFFAVLISSALQGVTVGWVARRLDVGDGATPWAPVAEIVPLHDGEPGEAELVEVDITADLHVCGRELRTIPVPGGGLITAVLRDGTVVVPSARTRLQAGDALLVLMPDRHDATELLVAWARGELLGIRSGVEGLRLAVIEAEEEAAAVGAAVAEEAAAVQATSDRGDVEDQAEEVGHQAGH